MILLDSSHDSEENEVLLVKSGTRVLDLWLDMSSAFWTYGLMNPLGQNGPNVVS